MAPQFRPPPGVRRELTGVDACEPRDERERLEQVKDRWLADNCALDGGKAPRTEREYQHVISLGREPGARGAWDMVPRSMPDPVQPEVDEIEPSPKRTLLSHAVQEAEQGSSAPELAGLPNGDNFSQSYHGDGNDAAFNNSQRNLLETEADETERS
jgi:hypothetical protein